MALLFMDSFDHYVLADITEKWTAAAIVNNGTQTMGATGRRSSGALRLGVVSAGSTASQAYCHKTLTPADATCSMGFAVSVSTGAAGTQGLQLASIRDGSAVQVTLRLNSDFTLSVLRGTQAGTVLGTTAAPITAGAFTYLEWKVAIHPSAGTVDLRVNGVVAMTPLTSQNTRSTAVTQWNIAALGVSDAVAQSWNTAATRTVDYDDLYVLDGSGSSPWNTFLGDCRVDVRNPTAAGNTTGWTPLAGSNWDNVNDTAPDDDTTYNSTSTTNAVDTFVTEDAPVAGAVLYGVQHCLSMKKTDAGTCTVAPVIRHSSVDYPGAALSPGTSYAYGLQIAQVNPGTSAQWTESDFNAAQFGYKRVS